MKSFLKNVSFISIAFTFFIATSTVFATTEDLDHDGDGLLSSVDNCPSISNADQADTDDDGFGDLCDNAPRSFNPDQADADGDKVGNVADNCPSVANANQNDADADGVGDACDNAPHTANPDQRDADGDHIGDVADNCPNNSNIDQLDTDHDGMGDVCDVPDTTAPVVGTITITPSGVRDNILYISGLSTLSAPVSDTDSGIDEASCLYATHNGMGGMTVVPSAYDSASGQCIFRDIDTSLATGIAISVRDKAGNQFDTSFSWVNIFVVDKTPPTARIEDPSVEGQVKGTVGLFISSEDNDSYVKEACVKYGTDAPQTTIGCKPLSEKDWNSNIYAPSFYYTWNTTTVTDGNYKLYAVVTDYAGNETVSSPISITINNTGIGSSASNPAPITTCQDFQNINEHPGWFYRLENDIDCSGIANFNDIYRFSGELNGQNHVIKNLKMTSIESSNRSIFDNLDSAGKITGVNFWNVDLVCNSTYCAGIVNFNGGVVEKSSIQGTMYCDGKCGGIASQNSGTISRSYADLTIRKTESGYGMGPAGLIAGHNYGGTIVNCYAKGKIISGLGTIGGLVGNNENSGVTTSYSAVDLKDAGMYGGLIGWQYQGGGQSASYWDVEVSGVSVMCGSTEWNDPASCPNAQGLSTSLMKTASSYVGWDFEDVWAVSATKNDGYPYLRGVAVYTEDSEKPVITLLGSATVAVTQGSTYTDAGATALDTVDGNLTAEIQTVSTVNTDTVGAYTVTYTVSDKAGNSATPVVRTVTVTKKTSSGSGSRSGSVAKSTRTASQPVVPPVITPVPPVTGEVLGANVFKFTLDLYQGVSGNEVTELQKRLRTEGLFSYPTDTGYFGPITKEAVIAFQKKNAVEPSVGYVGPLTRAVLNK